MPQHALTIASKPEVPLGEVGQLAPLPSHEPQETLEDVERRARAYQAWLAGQAATPLHQQDLTRQRFTQLQDISRKRKKLPGEDAFLSEPSGLDQIRDEQFRLRQLPGVGLIADQIAGALPDKGDPRVQVRQMPGLSLAAGEASQLDPVAVLGQPELDIAAPIGRNPHIAAAVGAAPIGAIVGASADPEHPVRGAALGAVVGGAGGVGAVSTGQALRQRYMARKFNANIAPILERLKEPDGGFTVIPVSGIDPAFGAGNYAVSPYPERGDMLPVHFKPREMQTRVSQFMTANRDLFSQPGHFLGGWHDPETGRRFIDISRVVQSPEEAHQIALAGQASGLREKSYFDFGTGKSVKVTEGGKPAVPAAPAIPWERPWLSEPMPEVPPELKQYEEAWQTGNQINVRYADTPDADPTVKKWLMDRQRQLLDLRRRWRGPNRLRDMIILGGGPGGMSAAVAAATEGLDGGLDALVIEAGPRMGGRAYNTSMVENYPGFSTGVSGQTLMDTMHDQATRLGTEFEYGSRVAHIHPDPHLGVYIVTLENGKTYTAKTVVVATGLTAKKLPPFPGDHSPGVFTDNARALTAYAKGGPVVVIGAGNDAAQAVEGAIDKGSHATMLIRGTLEDSTMGHWKRGVMRAWEKKGKLTIIENDQIDHLLLDAEGRPTHVVTKKGERKIPVVGLGIAIGAEAKTEWLPPELTRTKTGELVVNRHMETSLPGIYAVGDIQRGNGARINNATSDGIDAVKAAWYYIRGQKPPGGR